MAVSENDLVVGPLTPAEGVTTISLDFYFEQASWLEVYKSGSETPLVLNDDYTVAGAGTSSGVVTLTTAANGTDAYSIYLAVPLERSSDMQLRGEFKSEPFNIEMDRLWQALQGVSTGLSRALRVGKTSASVAAMFTEDKAARAGRVVQFDTDGEALLVGPSADDAGSSGAYAAQVAAEAARDTARRFASAPEDELVDDAEYPDEYSALHHAAKAQTFAGQSSASADASAEAQANSEAAEIGAEAAKAGAELARDAAVIGSATVYDDTAAGLAATSVGDYFTVPAAASDEYVELYKHEAGPTATLVKTYFTADALAADLADVLTRSEGVLIQTLNLFDKNDADYTEDFFVDWTDGSLQAESGTAPFYDATGFIPVTAGLQYYVSNISHIAWYDASKSFLSGSQNPSNPITAPASAAYIRCSLNLSTTTRDTFYVRQGAGPLAVYEPYGGKLAPSRVFDLTTSALADDAVTPLKTSFLTPGKNLFDTDSPNILENTFMGAAGSPVSSTTYFVSDFIEVEPGETYYISSAGQNARFLTAYDGAFNVVSAEGSNTNVSTVNVPASGVKYYRFTGYNANRATYQFEKGSAATGFQAFGFYFTDDIVQEGGTASASNWADKKWTSYGDSVTAQQEWQPFVVSELSLVHTVLGVGGRQIAGTSGMATQAGVDTIATDQELLTVMGGVNDWAQSRALGSVDSTDIEEFYGALNIMAERLTTRLPNCRIVMMTPNYCEFIDGNWQTRGGWTSGVLNAQGLGTRDYAEAIRVAAKRWGFPVVDVSAEEGVNSVNIDPYRKDDGNHIHPNEAGGKRIAEVLIGRLRDLEPIA